MISASSIIEGSCLFCWLWVEDAGVVQGGTRREMYVVLGIVYTGVDGVWGAWVSASPNVADGMLAAYGAVGPPAAFTYNSYH